MSASFSQAWLPPPVIPRMSNLLLGLIVFGVSLALLVRSRLGLDPWDVLHEGVARRSGIGLGVVVVGTGALALILWVPLRQRPGLGTILNVVVVGPVFEVAHTLLPHLESLPSRFAALAAGIVLNAIATGLYVGAGLGPGPRDGLMTGIAGLGPSIGRVRSGIEATVLAIGWLLGGTVGIGTVAYAMSIGPLVALALKFLSITTRPPSDPPAMPTTAAACPTDHRRQP